MSTAKAKPKRARPGRRKSSAKSELGLVSIHNGDARQTAEMGLVSIRQIPLSEISPSPENDEVYRRIDPDDPVIVAMAESMLLPEGVLEPLVVSLDGFIA